MVTLCDSYQKAHVLAKKVCPLNNGCSYKLDGNSTKKKLTLKVPITTAADNKFCNIFPNFLKKSGLIFHENRLPADDSHEICLIIFEKAAKFEIVVCCKV